MPDTTTRGLERRARLTASIDDQARALAARVRAGHLAPARLELAAYLGHDAAVVTLGRNPASGDLRAWAFGFDRFGPEVCLRAGLADAERCTRLIARALEGAGRGWSTDVTEAVSLHERVAHARLDALAGLVALPCSETRGAVDAAMNCEPELPTLDPVAVGRAVVDGSGLIVAATQALLAPGTLAEQALDGRPFSVGEWWPAEVDALTARRIRSAVRRAAVPWALGEREPLVAAAQGVLDRVEPASPCAASWEDMMPMTDKRTRWCNRCEQPVHDLSALDRAAALDLLRRSRGERLCIRLYRRADGRVLTTDCPVGLRRRGRALPRVLDEEAGSRLLGGWW